ncbi:MAG: isochorismatase family protein [Armatimonadota bacterium]|nr:isochorismatase family protein [Armatimonadota bacterium]
MPDDKAIISKFHAMTDTRHPHIFRRDDTVLVVVDMQEPFLRGIYERDRLTARVQMLVEAANILDVPILTTTQYAARMGPFVPEIASLLPAESSSIDKLAFSCAGSEAFLTALKDQNRTQVLLCGVETHICVGQTALDLSARGWQTHVAADAVSARSLETHKLGMERMRDSGVLPCAAEAAVYELLREAGTLEFKAILSLVK